MPVLIYSLLELKRESYSFGQGFFTQDLFPYAATLNFDPTLQVLETYDHLSLFIIIYHHL